MCPRCIALKIDSLETRSFYSWLYVYLTYLQCNSNLNYGNAYEWHNDNGAQIWPLYYLFDAGVRFPAESSVSLKITEENNFPVTFKPVWRFCSKLFKLNDLNVVQNLFAFNNLAPATSMKTRGSATWQNELSPNDWNWGQLSTHARIQKRKRWGRECSLSKSHSLSTLTFSSPLSTVMSYRRRKIKTFEF